MRIIDINVRLVKKILYKKVIISCQVFKNRELFELKI